MAVTQDPGDLLATEMISHEPDATHDPHEAVIDGFPVATRGADQAITLEDLADRFSAETRAGLEPTIDGYAQQFPQMADDIREVFPALLALEQWKLSKEADCLRKNVPRRFPLENLGEYRLQHEIGRGGMGVVFEAVQGPSKRRVAVKVLPWRYGSSMPRWKRRFEAEVRTISQLKHPNIIEVLGFGEQDGYCYYVMQLVEGVSLDRIIKRFLDDDEVCLHEELQLARADGTSQPATPTTGDEPPPQRLRRGTWREFARILYQAARGVDFAHNHGVLHNDVKPGNVLVDSLGRVRVGDFGLAKDLETDGEQPVDDLAGTLRYMAPERFSGQGDARSDVYSLGATLYELVTQTPLFENEDRGPLITDIEQAAFHPPRRVNPEVPPALENVILKAIEREPDDRYQTAQAFAADLLRFANGQPITATRPSALRRFWRRLLG